MQSAFTLSVHLFFEDKRTKYTAWNSCTAYSGICYQFVPIGSLFCLFLDFLILPRVDENNWRTVKKCSTLEGYSGDLGEFILLLLPLVALLNDNGFIPILSLVLSWHELIISWQPWIRNAKKACNMVESSFWCHF